eukprot:12324340-Alexandrium_andersonii.AAC.1
MAMSTSDAPAGPPAWPMPPPHGSSDGAGAAVTPPAPPEPAGATFISLLAEFNREDLVAHRVG